MAAKMNKTHSLFRDKSGHPLDIGDKVQCDGSEHGTVTRFGGLGVYVKMDFGKDEIDWALNQVEWQRDKDVR